MRTLRVQHNKIGQATYRLKQRDKKLFHACIGAIKNKNKQKAAICANESAEVRRLIRFLYNVELAIERVILRLETIKELSDIVFDLKPALRLLQGVSQELFDHLPDVSSELSKVNEAINETLCSTKITTDESVIPVNMKTPAGEEILNEVQVFLEQKLSENLPAPPITLGTAEPEKATLREMVALTTGCSETSGRGTIDSSEKNSSETLISYKKAEIQEISLKVENPQLEEILLDYAKRSNGQIDLARCSADLEASNEDIERALQSLGSKGKIIVEQRLGASNP